MTPEWAMCLQAERHAQDYLSYAGRWQFQHRAAEMMFEMRRAARRREARRSCVF